MKRHNKDIFNAVMIVILFIIILILCIMWQDDYDRDLERQHIAESGHTWAQMESN